MFLNVNGMVHGSQLSVIVDTSISRLESKYLSSYQLNLGLGGIKTEL